MTQSTLISGLFSRTRATSSTSLGQCRSTLYISLRILFAIMFSKPNSFGTICPSLLSPAILRRTYLTGTPEIEEKYKNKGMKTAKAFVQARSRSPLRYDRPQPRVDRYPPVPPPPPPASWVASSPEEMPKSISNSAHHTFCLPFRKCSQP